MSVQLLKSVGIYRWCTVTSHFIDQPVTNAVASHLANGILEWSEEV